MTSHRRYISPRRRRSFSLTSRATTETNEFARFPAPALRVPIWLLGSSLFSAQLAAELGLPFAFASHFAPADMMQALASLSNAFPAFAPARPSLHHARPERASSPRPTPKLVASSHPFSKPSPTCGAGRPVKFLRPSTISTPTGLPRRKPPRAKRCSARSLARREPLTGTDEFP